MHPFSSIELFLCDYLSVVVPVAPPRAVSAPLQENKIHELRNISIPKFMDDEDDDDFTEESNLLYRKKRKKSL